MAKNRDLTEADFDAYLQSHEYEDPLTEEEFKIRREHMESDRLSRRAKKRKRQTSRVARDHVDARDDEWAHEQERKAERLRNNARMHKQRLQGKESYPSGDWDED